MTEPQKLIVIKGRIPISLKTLSVLWNAANDALIFTGPPPDSFASRGTICYVLSKTATWFDPPEFLVPLSSESK